MFSHSLCVLQMLTLVFVLFFSTPHLSPLPPFHSSFPSQKSARSIFQQAGEWWPPFVRDVWNWSAVLFENIRDTEKVLFGGLKSFGNRTVTPKTFTPLPLRAAVREWSLDLSTAWIIAQIPFSFIRLNTLSSNRLLFMGDWTKISLLCTLVRIMVFGVRLSGSNFCYLTICPWAHYLTLGSTAVKWANISCSIGSSACEILQARILEWVANPFFRGSSWPRDWTGSPEL